MKEHIKVFRGLTAGLMAWLFVWFAWRPLLNSNGHLISFGLSSVRNTTLLGEDYWLVLTFLAAQAVASGMAVSVSRRTHLAAAIIEFFVPWSLFYLWVLVLAPPQDSFNVIEMLCWASLPILLNLAISSFYSLLLRAAAARLPRHT